MRKGPIVVAVIIIAFAGSRAHAADSSIPAYKIDDAIPAYKNESFPPADSKLKETLRHDWTGPYVGINIGGEIGTSVWSKSPPFAPSTTISVSGAAVGAILGYNFQFGQWVAGVDADIDWTNARGSTACPILGSCETRSAWIGTTRGRVGYAFDRILPYATAGLAFGQLAADSTLVPFNTTSTKFGYAAGVGVEYAIYGPWTGKVEYLYVNLQKLSCSFSCGQAGPFSIDFSSSTIKAGLSYRY
jgi:outer membrane immunogenic protein